MSRRSERGRSLAASCLAALAFAAPGAVSALAQSSSGLGLPPSLMGGPSLTGGQSQETAPPAKAATSTPGTQPSKPAPPSKALRASYKAAFAQTLQNPSDPKTLAHFAEVAVQFGDIEGAISALERLLLVDSDEPQVKLELGVLYYRLGSTEAARTYLQEVRDSNDASEEAKERAAEYLKAAAMKK
jgi:Flp pilus assembly protein TadD